MAYRMISIVVAVAAFALLFSLLAKQEGAIRPEAARVACQDTATGCARPFVR